MTDGLAVTGRFAEYLEELREAWPPRPDLRDAYVLPVARSRDEPIQSISTRT